MHKEPNDQPKKWFTFERKVSLDTILTLCGIFVGLTILYARLVALEIKVDGHEKHLDKLDNLIERLVIHETK